MPTLQIDNDLFCKSLRWGHIGVLNNWQTHWALEYDNATSVVIIIASVFNYYGFKMYVVYINPYTYDWRVLIWRAEIGQLINLGPDGLLFQILFSQGALMFT